MSYMSRGKDIRQHFISVLVTALGKVPLGLLDFPVNLMSGVKFAEDARIKQNHLLLAVLSRNEDGVDAGRRKYRTSYAGAGNQAVIAAASKAVRSPSRGWSP